MENTVTFIASDHKIKELEEVVNIFLRKEERENLSDKEKEICRSGLSKLNNELDSFTCYLLHNYDNQKDIKELHDKFSSFFLTLSKRYNESYLDFKRSKDFESKMYAFMRDQKIRIIVDE